MSLRNDLPLCVDLDGTLSRSDSLWEAILLLARTRPWQLLALPFWLLGGKAAFKARVAAGIKVDELALPWNELLLEYLERDPARPLYLVSGADGAIAAAVVRRWPRFAGYFASDGKTNLTGEAKARLLREKFGQKGFDYAGNEWKDFAVWAQARGVLVVSASAGVAQAARRQFPESEVIGEGRVKMRELLNCLRPHQWVKNLLIFVPLFTAHRFHDGLALSRAGLAFVAFCGVASAFYIFNDLLDLQADRRHALKRFRPVCSGAVPIPAALGVMVASFVVGAGCGAWLGWPFVWVLAGYAAISALYSLVFKRLPIVDVMVLGGLYTIRIVAGAVATDVPLSSWLLIFSLFLFLSLGLAKRFTELKAKREVSEGELAGRGYEPGDLEYVSSLGIASGYIATLVFALYISSDKVSGLYRNPQVLWAIVVLLLYWISRIWLIAHRGQLHHDPIIFALKDRVSYAVLASALLVVYLAGPY
jgi:4-hydroxybenzoate polyprenyltransferase